LHTRTLMLNGSREERPQHQSPSVRPQNDPV
jgi:hypothetical protein